MLKHLITGLMCYLMVTLLPAQEQTLFSGASRVGGFGGPIFEFGSIQKQSGTSTGGGGGVIVNDFFFGGFGMGADYADLSLPDGRYQMDMGYGGLWLGYVPLGDRVIHPYATFRIGWGSVSLNRRGNFPDLFESTDQIFVLAPEGGLEINVFRWFRIAGTVGYRWVDGVNEELAGLTENDFRSINGGLTLRFGGFGYNRRNTDYR